jgi:hypothetical protein
LALKRPGGWTCPWLVLYVVALPLVMACGFLIKDSMKFIRIFLLANLFQKVIK